MGDIIDNINNSISNFIKKQNENLEPEKVREASENAINMAQDIKNKELTNENPNSVFLKNYDNDGTEGVSKEEFSNFIKDAYGEDQFSGEEIDFIFNTFNSSAVKDDVLDKNEIDLENMSASSFEEGLNSIDKDELETLNDDFVLQQDGTYKKTFENGSTISRTIEKQDNGITVVEDVKTDASGNVSKEGHRTDIDGRLQSDWVYGKDKDGNETKLGTWYKYDEDGNQSVSTYYEYTFHEENGKKTAELRKWNSDGNDALNNKPDDKDLDYLFEIEYENDGKTEKSRTYTQEKGENTVVGQYDNIGQRISEEETDKNGKVIRKTEFQVNIDNDDIKTSETNNEYNSNNELGKTTESTFNENGDLTQTKEAEGTFDGNNQIQNGTVTVKDKDGKVTETRVFANCEYDENGINPKNGEVTYKDENGKVTETKVYTDCERDEKGYVTNGERTHKDENGKVTKSEVYADCKYDEKGYVTNGEVTYKDENGKVTGARIYTDCECDENGKIINGEVTLKDKDGKVTGTNVYKNGDKTSSWEYTDCKFNENGNIINGEVTLKDKDGKVIKTEIYKNGKMTVK